MNLLALLVGIQLSVCDCANILYAVPFTSKSHDIFLQPIGVELARRGHNVTVITAFEVTDPPPNYHQIVIPTKELWEMIGGERPNVFTTINMGVTEFIDKILWDGGLAFTEYLLNTTQMQAFLKADNKFDLVISEAFLEEAIYMLAVKYNTPLVLVTAFGNCMRHNVVVGNPLQLATTLYEFAPIKDPTSFLGRFKNLYISIYEYLTWRFRYLPQQEMLVEKYIPDLPHPTPSLYEVLQNVSLFMINGHFSYDTPVAYLPNIVEIGGVHTNWYNESIPQDLEKVLDESTNGVVYVNFGSNIRSAELPDEKRLAFLSAFRRLKHTVLWKWEGDTMQDKPPNVITRKWFPQRKILAHPNIKLFIGHGGLMSTQEAIYYGVPIIGMPIYADQYNNLLILEQAGFGLLLEYHSINDNSVENTIENILTNNSYMNKAKEMSKRFMERPMRPLDTAMFWVEYVLRNNGASYMKSPTRNMHWLVSNMLDVYASILFIIVFILYVLYKIIAIVFQLFSLQAKEKKKRMKKE